MAEFCSMFCKSQSRDNKYDNKKCLLHIHNTYLEKFFNSQVRDLHVVFLHSGKRPCFQLFKTVARSRRLRKIEVLGSSLAFCRSLNAVSRGRVYLSIPKYAARCNGATTDNMDVFDRVTLAYSEILSAASITAFNSLVHT